MGGKMQSKGLKKILSLVLALALVFTLTPLSGSLLTDTVYAEGGSTDTNNSDTVGNVLGNTNEGGTDTNNSDTSGTKYTTESEPIKISLAATDVDKLNDEITLTVSLDDTMDIGLSGICFSIDYDGDAFSLIEVEDYELIGVNEDTVTSQYPNPWRVDDDGNYCDAYKASEPATDDPYKIIFGNMDNSNVDQTKWGVSTNTGKLCSFTFKARSDSNGKFNASTTTPYEFKLTGIEAVALRVVNSGVNSEVVKTYAKVNDKTEYTDGVVTSYSYQPIASSGTVSTEDKGSITITKPEASGDDGTKDTTPVIKTETIEKAIEQVEKDTSETKAETITFDASSDEAGKTEKDSTVTEAEVNKTTTDLAISKTGAGKIAEAEKKMTVKTKEIEFEFDKDALDNISKRGGGEQLNIKVEKKDKIETKTKDGDSEKTEYKKAVFFDVTAELTKPDGEVDKHPENIGTFGGGKVKVSIDVPEDWTGAECWYIHGGHYSKMPGEFDANNHKFCFETTHFSEYAVGPTKVLEEHAAAKNYAKGYTISGTITSYGDEDGKVTVKLNKDETDVDTASAGTNARSSSCYTNGYSATVAGTGDYILTVSKAGHATWTETITLSEDEQENATWSSTNAEINLYGDVNRDGKVDASDAQQLQRYVAGISGNCIDSITYDNALKTYVQTLADANNDKKYTAADAQEIQRAGVGLPSTIDNL